MTPPKQLVIQTMRRAGRLPLLPFGVRLAIARRFRRLRFFLPPGHQFIDAHYLGHLRVHIDTTYPIEVEMATGQYDLTTSQIIRRFVKAEDTVLDIGANVGALTLLMATVAQRGRVFAIEPGPPTFARLQQNLALNPALTAHVTAHQLGMADDSGELCWQEDGNVPGNAGLFSQGGTRVPVETLDRFVKNHHLERLDFIKIDVEGMEYEVIKGGLEAIAQFRPILYYETLEAFRQQRGFDVYRRICALFKDLGYQQFCVLSKGQIVAIDNLDQVKSPNTLAIPIDKLKDWTIPNTAPQPDDSA